MDSVNKCYWIYVAAGFMVLLAMVQCCWIYGERHNCGSVQIINGQGRFNLPSCEKFQKDVKLADYKRSYALVSIVGPQSSGKSTLLNNVFGTTFAQMDTLGGGRAKCTDGIWLERADITENCILVMDLEGGTDGKEKQAVMRLLSRRKTTVMFVIHDTDDIKTIYKMSTGRKKSSFDEYSKISEEKWKAMQKEKLKEMESSLKEDIRRIWDFVSKPEAHERTPFCAFYNIEVVFLSHPSDVQFGNELDRLSQEFHDSIVPGVLAGDREDVVDGSSFSCNAQLLWKKIKKNEDLDLPDHKLFCSSLWWSHIGQELGIFRLPPDGRWVWKLAAAGVQQLVSSSIAALVGFLVCLSRWFLTNFGVLANDRMGFWCQPSWDHLAHCDAPALPFFFIAVISFVLCTSLYINKVSFFADKKKMVATVRCEQIANEKFESFVASKEWLKECKAVQTPKISDFGKELSEMKKNCLSSYDEEATYLDRDVKLKNRKQLEEKLDQHVRPTYQVMLQRIKSECLENFKKAFNDLLVGGEKLIEVARKCVDYTITQFEEKRRDARIDQANGDLLWELKVHMASHIYTVAKQMHGKDRTNFKKLLMKGIARALIPSSSEPALNIVSQPAAVETVASAVKVAGKVAVGAIKPAVVATGASAPVVAVGAGVGVGFAAITAAATTANSEKRKMTKIINYIIVEVLNLSSSACTENEFEWNILGGPSSVRGEN